MKILLVANQKGGVGKSAITTQLAYYFAEKRKKRVLLMDFDHQKNTTKAVALSGLASVSDTLASQVLGQRGVTIEQHPFVLVPGDPALKAMEKQGAAQHNVFATNLKEFLHRHKDAFDVCIIDTNPNPDIRMLAALVAADFVLSPIMLNQEAIDGIGSLLNDISNVRKAKLNQTVKLIGILPNLTAPTPFQKANFAELVKHFSSLLIGLNGGQMAQIKQSTAITEAQAQGKPIFRMDKTSARTAWANIEPVFERVAVEMGAYE